MKVLKGSTSSAIDNINKSSEYYYRICIIGRTSIFIIFYDGNDHIGMHEEQDALYHTNDEYEPSEIQKRIAIKRILKYGFGGIF